MLIVFALMSCMVFTRTFAAPCQYGWINFGKSCYYGYVYPLYTYDEAKTLCTELRGNLVVIDDAEENLFLRQYTQKEYSIWIGLNDKQEEGTWVWENGDKVTYTNWNDNEPNNAKNNEDCALIWADKDGKWNDSSCTNRRGFVCETKKRGKN